MSLNLQVTSHPTTETSGGARGFLEGSYRPQLELMTVPARMLFLKPHESAVGHSQFPGRGHWTHLRWPSALQACCHKNSLQLTEGASSSSCLSTQWHRLRLGFRLDSLRHTFAMRLLRRPADLGAQEVVNQGPMKPTSYGRSRVREIALLLFPRFALCSSPPHSRRTALFSTVAS